MPSAKLLQLFRLNGNIFFSSGFLLPVFLHPGFPAFARGHVAATESKGRDFSIRNRGLAAAVLRKEPYERFSKSLPIAPVENVTFNFASVLTRDEHIAAIVEGAFQCLAQICLGSERRHGPFQFF